MKKITSVLIALIIVLSTVSLSVNAVDYEGHWAEAEIMHLLNQGIVSGYSGGEIKPEAPLTRAETAKIINKAFGYYELSEEGFNDVNPTDWYYKDLLIAKKAGFMIGDNFGNASPNKKISRAEYCTVIARILKLDINEKETKFTDNSKIPEWARGYIKALSDKGIINGYSDGSFKAENSVKRAEAFYVISGIMKQAEPEINEIPKELPSVIPTQSSPSGGGGGGGGGGGSSASTSNVLSVPVMRQFDELTSTVYFDSVNNADKYELLIITDEFEKSYDLITQNSGSSLEANLTAFIQDAKDTYPSANFNATLKIRASGSGYIASGYIEIGTLNEELPAVAKPIVDYIVSGSGADEIFDVSWNEIADASGYDVKLYIDGAESNSLATIDLGLRTLKLNTSYSIDKNVVLKISAISGNSALKNSAATECVLSLSAFPGSGTEADPYIIRSAAQLLNITDKTAVYVIADNITVDNWIAFGDAANPFSGKITGKLNNVEGEKPTVTISVNSFTDYQGFIGVLDGGKISNIIIDGNVNGANNVGGICGFLKAGEITDCISKAAVTASNSGAGGIAGRCDGKIIRCGNAGNVTANTTGAGGISGILNNTVEQCYNSGTIAAPNYASGIAGNGRTTSSSLTITDCYNSGEIKSNNSVAGICYTAGTNEVTEYVTFTNNYNAGEINSDSLSTKWQYAVYSTDIHATVEKIINNNYYLNTLTVSNTNIAGVVPVGLSDSELQSLPEGFSSDIWEIKENSYGYKYPQLKYVPHIEGIKVLSAPTGIFVLKENGVFTLSYTGVANASSYIAEVWQNDVKINEYPLLGNVTSTDITDSINGAGTYNIKIKALGDGIAFSNSPYGEYEYIYTIAPGSDENPYIIASQQDFEAITDLTAVYKITTDLTVTSPLGEFSGKLIGDKGEGVKPVITLNISANVNNTGFVSVLKGITAIIDNFEFRGTVNGAESTGAAAGNLEDGAKVRNCVNYANITGTVAVGGIVGNNKFSTIEKSSNHGEIEATTQAAGGIVGISSGIVSRCFNTALITGASVVGGIAGNMTADDNVTITISNCYNTGNIKTEGSNIGGICGRPNKGKVSYCYNAGLFERVASKKWCYNITEGAALEGNNYFHENVDGGGGNTGLANVYKLTEAEMQDLNNFVDFDTEIWYIDSEDTTYKYPKLK